MNFYEDTKGIVIEYLRKPDSSGEDFMLSTTRAISSQMPLQANGESSEDVHLLKKQSITSAYYANRQDMVLVKTTESDGTHFVTGPSREETLEIYDFDKGVCLRVAYQKPGYFGRMLDKTGITMTSKKLSLQEHNAMYETMMALRKGEYQTPAKQIHHYRMAAAV